MKLEMKLLLEQGKVLFVLVLICLFLDMVFSILFSLGCRKWLVLLAKTFLEDSLLFWTI